MDRMEHSNPLILASWYLLTAGSTAVSYVNNFSEAADLTLTIVSIISVLAIAIVNGEKAYNIIHKIYTKLKK